MSRDILIKLTYTLVVILMITAAMVVIHHENPERLIQGEWVEKDWKLRKDNVSKEVESNFELQARLRKEILQNVEDLHLEVWSFKENGTLISAIDSDSEETIKWLIKGRGHILELQKDGKQLESFQIQQINKDRLVLHLNFDLQVKGIIEIVLERKEQVEQYVKKV